MRWDGYVKMQVSKIALTGDIGARMKMPHVIALAESTDELGGEPMHAPSINADVTPVELVAGRDRMAATLLRKRKTVWVHVGRDWSPLDLLKAEIHENLHRRHDDKSALIKSLVDKAESIVVLGKTSQNPSPSPQGGRPRSDRREAQEIVADATGDSLALVKKHDQIAAGREERQIHGMADGGDLPSPAPERKAPIVETNGLELPERVAAALRPIVDVFKRVDGQLVKAQAISTDLGITSFSPVVAQRIKSILHDAAAQVRHAMPTHLCPKCEGKSVPVAGPFCGLCQEQGAVTKAQFDAAPKKRGGWTEEESAAGLDAEPVVAAAPRSSKPKSRGKVVVVAADGTEVEVGPDGKPVPF